MEKIEKNTIEETKDNEIVELKDEDMSTITAGASNQQKNEEIGGLSGDFIENYANSALHKNKCDKNLVSVPSISGVIYGGGSNKNNIP